MEEKLPNGDADGELHGDHLLIAERVIAARPGGAIRMGKLIDRIIARDNPELPVLPPARMIAPLSPERAGPSGLNAHLPLFRCRVDSSDEDEPERPMCQPRRPHLVFDDGDYEQKDDTGTEPPRRRKKARRRVNPFIYAEFNVDGEASNDNGSDDENDDLDGLIVADDIGL